MGDPHGYRLHAILTTEFGCRWIDYKLAHLVACLDQLLLLWTRLVVCLVLLRILVGQHRHDGLGQRIVEELLNFQRIHIVGYVGQLHVVVNQDAALAEAIDAHLLVPLA